MPVIGASTAPFIFSALLAAFSPIVRRLVRVGVRSDLEELQEEDHISRDGLKYVLPVIRRAVGTVQMVTALLITTVSGGIRLHQSINVGEMAIVANLFLTSVSISMFGYLYASNSYTYSAGVGLPLLPIRIQRAPLFIIGLNMVYFFSICLTGY